MPEAVIVSAARSPIGRAFKGSLKDLRADDLTATIIQTALAKVPELDPKDIDDLMLGCGLPGGEQGNNLGRIIAVQMGMDHLPGCTVTRYCSSSLQTSRMALHAIKAGEGDVFISAGVEMVSRFAKGNSDSLPDTHNPLFADAEARTAARAEQLQRQHRAQQVVERPADRQALAEHLPRPAGRPRRSAAYARTYSAYASAHRSPWSSQTSRTSSQITAAASRSPRNATAMASSTCAIRTLLFNSPTSRYRPSASRSRSSARSMSSVTIARHPVRCTAYASAVASPQRSASSRHSWSAEIAPTASPWSTATYPGTHSTFSRAASCGVGSSRTWSSQCRPSDSRPQPVQ
ncbi:3-ketoacyl-CoA thiolase [Streptomyces badius]